MKSLISVLYKLIVIIVTVIDDDDDDDDMRLISNYVHMSHC